MDLNLAYVVGAVVLNNLVLWVWKPWAQAYAGEKGKNLARREDLEKIVTEVKEVMATTEATKAEVSGALWVRQIHWNQKRDLYVSVL